VTIVPILEEVLVVEKRLLIKEELRITRHRTTNVTDVAVPLRKQRAEIERLKGDSK
jgi:stress response protein YsnF